jgi:hypothetical protein
MESDSIVNRLLVSQIAYYYVFSERPIARVTLIAWFASQLRLFVLFNNQFLFGWYISLQWNPAFSCLEKHIILPFAFGGSFSKHNEIKRGVGTSLLNKHSCTIF